MSSSREVIRDGKQYFFSCDSEVVGQVCHEGRVWSWLFAEEGMRATAVACVVGIDGVFQYVEVPEHRLNRSVADKQGTPIAVLEALISYPEFSGALGSILSAML
jgi:hypothetical protein